MFLVGLSIDFPSTLFITAYWCYMCAVEFGCIEKKRYAYGEVSSHQVTAYKSSIYVLTQPIFDQLCGDPSLQYIKQNNDL